MAHACPLCGGPVPGCEAFTDGVSLFFIAGHLMRLAPSAYLIFSVLYKRRPNVVHLETLIGLLYDHSPRPPADPDNVVKVQVCKVRRKLGGAGRIESVWGEGYRLLLNPTAA